MIDVREELADLRQPPPALLHQRTILAADAGDQVSTTPSAYGPLWISWSRVGVTGLTPLFIDETADDYIEKHRRAGFLVDSIPTGLARDVEAALRDGEPGDLRFDLRGLSQFQASVLMSCLTISCGTVRPYGWIADQLEKPGSTRAVGTALAKNPIPLLIPCHRVVRTDGSVGNYAFGPQMKTDLLVAEGALLPGT